MKLEDVLNGGPRLLTAQDHLLLFLDGSVETDGDPAYFRLYRNPQNRRSYLLVKKADVAGDLCEWTAEEVRQAGFVCAKVYRVPLMFGTELQNVSIAIHKLGETIAGDTAGSGAQWAVLGDLNGVDIEAIVFIVLMQASKEADQDLKTIMAEVKAITAAKGQLRELIAKVNRDAAANAGQKDGQPPLDFSTGMGNEAAYHQAKVPLADPESECGVKFVPTDLYHSQLEDVAQLRCVRDGLRDQLDGMSEMSEMMSLRLQMMMDRRSKFVSTLSNIMKKISTTQDTLVQNLK